MNRDGRVEVLLDDLDGLLTEAAELVNRGRAVYDADSAIRRACEAVCIHIGEIAKRVTALDPARFSDDIWSAVARNRDLLAHHYDRVDRGQLWITMSVHLPTLAPAISVARARGGSGSS